jgi:plastocyanin
MRFKMIPFVVSMVALALASFGAENTATTQSASSSSTGVMYSLHGQVKAGANLDLHKIDLTRVVIYLESDPVLDSVPIPSEHPAVAQKNKEFIPKFIVVPKGTVVEFPNWDHIAHNVFSRSAAAPAFDLDRYPFGQSKSRQFQKIGIVQIFCNIHPSMRAIVFVTPNIFSSRADKEGQFEIKNLPAGHYQVTAWQERCKPLHQPLNVGPGGNAEITFNLEEDRDSIISNDPPKHAGYGVEHGLGVKQEQLNLPVVKDAHPAPSPTPCEGCK